MKKLILSIFMITALASFAEGNTVDVRAGFDFSSKAKIKDENGSFDLLKRGFELGAEYRRNLGTGFEVGGGIFYKTNSFKKNAVGEPILDEDGSELNVTSKKFNAFPIYATARYNFTTPSEDIVPYVKANLGYSINSGKLESKYTTNTSTYPDVAGRIDESYKFKNGLYYGLGTGLKYKNFFVDLSYNVIRSKVENTYMSSVYHTNINGVRGTTYEYDKWNTKVNNKFVTLSFGYSFGF